MNHTHRKGIEGKKKKRNPINWVEKPVTAILVHQDSDYVSERRSPDQVTCPLLQKIRSKGFKGNWWWQFLHLYAMWHTRSKLLTTFWTICQGTGMIIFFYILLLRSVSHLGVLHPAPCPTTLLFFFFSQNSNIHLWCNIFAAHQNSYAKLQKGSWIQRMKRMTSLQTWTFNKITLKKLPLCGLLVFFFFFCPASSFLLFPCICNNSNYCQASGCSCLWATSYTLAEVFVPGSHHFCQEKC